MKGIYVTPAPNARHGGGMVEVNEPFVALTFLPILSVFISHAWFFRWYNSADDSKKVKAWGNASTPMKFVWMGLFIFSSIGVTWSWVLFATHAAGITPALPYALFCILLSFMDVVIRNKAEGQATVGNRVILTILGVVVLCYAAIMVMFVVIFEIAERPMPDAWKAKLFFDACAVVHGLYDLIYWYPKFV